MAEYVDADKAAAIAGVASTYVTSTLQEWVRGRIDLELGRDFQSTGEVTTSDPEVHTIKDSYMDSIQTKNFPILAVSRLRDNILSDNVLTLNEVNYHIEKESGIILLKYDARAVNTGVTRIDYFTKGVGTVDIAYTYGFASVPSEVQTLANWMAAMLAKFAYTEGLIGSGVTTEVTIGDYKEKKFYDEKYKGIAEKYKDDIDRMYRVLHKWRK